MVASNIVWWGAIAGKILPFLMRCARRHNAESACRGGYMIYKHHYSDTCFYSKIITLFRLPEPFGSEGISFSRCKGNNFFCNHEKKL